MPALPQKFFYPLYHSFDQKFFGQLKKATKHKYQFLGGDQEKIFFIKSLFYYQLLNKNYRKHLQIISQNLAPKTDIEKINQLTRKAKFAKDLSWATWKYEKEMVKLASRFWQSKKTRIKGTDTQFNEFVLRYLISVWLIDWAAPLHALLSATKNGAINLKECNKILSAWDFTNIFVNY